MTANPGIPEYHMRQEAILPMEQLIWPIHVIGLGAVGSYLTLALAKLGARELYGYDPEQVVPENVGTQIYGPTHVGQPKAVALGRVIEQLTGLRPDLQARAIYDEPLAGIVVLAVDTMHDRAQIFRSIDGRAAVRWLLDVRIGFTPVPPHSAVGLLFTVRPCDPADVAVYRRSLHDDRSVLPLNCRAAGIVTASMSAAAQVAHRISQVARGEAVPLLERVFPLPSAAAGQAC